MHLLTPFGALVITSFVVAAATFVLLLFIAAPYGRHARVGWGPTLSNQLGWVLMEAPAALILAGCMLVGENERTITQLALLALWELHYVYRAFIYPFRLRGDAKRMPLVIPLMGLGFNLMNGYLNGHYLFALSAEYTAAWLRDPRFVLGVALFVGGLWINRSSDATLRRLRAPGETGYKIPEGGLYQWISCPNYLGEITQWIGWAVATWSLPGLAFAVWTIANLAPRARTHHRWYRQQFPDYPTERKALVPGLW